MGSAASSPGRCILLACLWESVDVDDDVHCSGIVIADFDGRVADCADRSLRHRLGHIEDKQVRLELLGQRYVCEHDGYWLLDRRLLQNSPDP